MSLTLEQRRDINRENARKSTGPKTARGKANSRKNAMKHGLRSEVLALPHEDPAIIAERATSWIDYYQPQSPAAQHLVNECVQATILSDRVNRYHHFALSGQIRDARKAWLNQSEDEVKKRYDLMGYDPAEAVRLLKRSGLGVRSLISRWEGFRKRFHADGCLNGEDCDQAISLLGCRSTLEDMKENPGAYMLCLFNALANVAPSEAGLQTLCDPKNVPPSLRHKIKDVPCRPPEECRTWIKNLITKELGTLQTLAQSLEEIEFLDFGESEDRALILHDETDARLFLRYHAESRNTFHRAFNKLEKTLISDAAGESCVESEAPNEPNPRDWADVESEAAIEPEPQDWADAREEAPNEPELRDWADVEAGTASPNEADLDARGPDTENGTMGKWKPVVMSLLLIFLLFSARFASAIASPNEADPGRHGTAIVEVAPSISERFGREIDSSVDARRVRHAYPFATMRL